jgi:hypothetical protein
VAARLRKIAPVQSGQGALEERSAPMGYSHVGHVTRATHDLLRLWKFVLPRRGCGGYRVGLPYTGGAGILSLFPRPLFTALNLLPALPTGAGACMIPACLSSAQTSVAAGPMVEGMSR